MLCYNIVINKINFLIICSNNNNINYYNTLIWKKKNHAINFYDLKKKKKLIEDIIIEENGIQSAFEFLKICR